MNSRRLSKAEAISPAGDETRSARSRPRLWPPIVLVGAFYVLFVGLRIAQEGVLWFVHLGRLTLESANTSSALAGLEWQSEVGYDGQYYYALAVDPANASDYMDGKAGYVYARPFFPALSRLVSLGQVDFVPHGMLLINVSAVLLGTAALAAWLRRNDVSPWFSAVYGLYPGLVFSVFHDLTEPLAYGLVAIALWFFDPKDGRRVAAAGATLALAALTRETVVLFALVGAVALARRRRSDGRRRWSWSRWRIPIAFLAATTGPLFVWKAIVGAVVQEPTQESPGGAVALIPFYGIASYWPWGAHHTLVVVAVVVPTVSALALGLPLVIDRRWRLCGALLVLNAAAFVVFLPKVVYVDYGAAGRAAIGVVLATICCIPAWKALSDGGRPPLHLVSLTWSLPWYFVAAVGFGLPALALLTS